MANSNQSIKTYHEKFHWKVIARTGEIVPYLRVSDKEDNRIYLEAKEINSSYVYLIKNINMSVFPEKYKSVAYSKLSDNPNRNMIEDLIFAQMMYYGITNSLANIYESLKIFEKYPDRVISKTMIGYHLSQIKSEQEKGLAMLKEVSHVAGYHNAYRLYSIHLYNSKDPQCFTNFQAIRNAEYAEGFRWLAKCYKEGIGCTKDDKKVFDNYYASAGLGYAPAQYEFAKMNSESLAFGKDLDKAIKWMFHAAKQNYKDSGVLLKQYKVAKSDEMPIVKPSLVYISHERKERYQQKIKEYETPISAIEYNSVEFGRQEEKLYQIVQLMKLAVENGCESNDSNLLFDYEQFFTKVNKQIIRCLSDESKLAKEWQKKEAEKYTNLTVEAHKKESELEQKNQKLTSEINEKIAENQKLTVAVDEKTKYVEELLAYIGKIECGLAEKVNQYTEQGYELNEKIVKIKDLARLLNTKVVRISQLETKITELEKQKVVDDDYEKHLQKQLDIATEDRNEYIEKYHNSNEKNQLLEKSLSAEKEKNNQLTKDQDVLEKQYVAQKSCTTGIIESLNIQIDKTIKITQESYQNNLQLMETRKSLDQMTKTNEQLQFQITEEKSYNNNLQKVFCDLQDRLVINEQQRSKFQQTILTIESQVVDKDREINKLKSELDVYKTQQQISADESKSMGEKISKIKSLISKHSVNVQENSDFDMSAVELQEIIPNIATIINQ